jgi:hypothetical protein
MSDYTDNNGLVIEAKQEESPLVADLKKRAARIPAEHVQVFFEFLAHHAEPLGLLPDQPDSRDVLSALFSTFIPAHQHDEVRSFELFDDAVKDVETWNANAADGDRDFAERTLDLSLRQLAPPARDVKPLRAVS